jgi:hypothetical protein
MLRAVRRMLGFQLTIAELLGIALIVGVPYLIVGAFWSTSHSAHLQDAQGADLVVSFLGSMVAWPVLLFTDVCMT